MSCRPSPLLKALQVIIFVVVVVIVTAALTIINRESSFVLQRIVDINITPCALFCVR